MKQGMQAWQLILHKSINIIMCIFYPWEPFLIVIWGSAESVHSNSPRINNIINSNKCISQRTRTCPITPTPRARILKSSSSSPWISSFPATATHGEVRTPYLVLPFLLVFFPLPSLSIFSFLFDCFVSRGTANTAPWCAGCTPMTPFCGGGDFPPNAQDSC